MSKLNFLPKQYAQTGALPINHNYLQQQFSDYPEIFKKIEQLILEGDYTLGTAVDQFEQRFAKIAGTTFALGVGSGTDAIFLSLKACGVGPGDEVITTPYTFFATVGAIVTAGARPVFVDVKEDYNIDVSKVEAAITKKTKAIVPVHWSGLPCDMDEMMAIAKQYKLDIVEDSCHGIMASYKNKAAGSFGTTGCFSMHPLKNLNVWGDGGVITTNNEAIYKKLALMRNHGLINRNECAIFAYNSRLDTLQAIVANHLLEKIEQITQSRIDHALYLDNKLKDIAQLTVPTRHKQKKQVFHIYCIQAERRDQLVQHLINCGVDAKIHYPIPMHLQPAAKEFGYKKGDFPKAESICNHVFSLPVHEFLTTVELDKMTEAIKGFYQ